MMYQELTPDSRLSHLIEYYWMLEAEVDAAYNPEILFPDTSTHLAIVADAEPYMLGSRVNAMQVERSETGHSLFGIKFRPGGYYSLFGKSPGEITNTVAEVSALRLFPSGILDSLSPQMELKQFFDEWFLQFFRNSKTPDKRIMYAVHRIECSMGQINIRNLKEEIFLSSRQFERIFKEQIGISAKRYAQITRFNHAVTTLQTATDKNLASLAYDLGYFDYPHMTHDFMKLSGATPANFLDDYKTSLFYNN